MPQPAAVVFALSMAVWVADVRFAPVVPAEPSAAVVAATCESGPSNAAPDDADAEVVVCAPREAR